MQQSDNKVIPERSTKSASSRSKTAQLLDRLEAVVVAYREGHRIDYSPWKSQWRCEHPHCGFESGERQRYAAQLAWEDFHGKQPNG